MKKTFLRFWRRWISPKNKSIRWKMMSLILSAGIVSFLVLTCISYYGMSVIRQYTLEMGKDLGESGANYTQTLMTNQLKQTLSELAESRAAYIESQMRQMRQDVVILSERMTEIMQHQQNYLPLEILDPRDGPVPMGETYITYSPDLHADGISASLRYEIEIASNIRNYLVPLAKSYIDYKSSFYVGSKYGYFICSSIFPKQKFSPVEIEEIYEYDPRQRPWYKNAMTTGEPTFSDLYRNIVDDGYQLIGCSAPYYDSNGIAGVVGLDVSNTDIYKAVVDTAIGEKGFSFVLNSSGEVIFSSRMNGVLATKVDGGDIRQTAEPSLAEAAKQMTAGKSGVLPVIVDGSNYYLAYSPMETVGWSFGTLTLQEEILAASSSTQTYFVGQINDFQQKLQNEFSFLLKVAIVVLIALVFAAVFLSNKFSGRIVKPLLELSDDVREITSGNFDKKIDIRTGDEIEHLATCFNAMIAELKTYMANLTKVTAEKERIATELNVARDIQHGMLPNIFPPYPDRREFDIYATMNAAKEVGGDFYDLYLLDENHLVITVADVSGKGIPASLFMVISKTVLKNFATFATAPDDYAAVLSCANNQLCKGNEEMMFVTVFFGVLEIDTGRFTFVNGGHNPPVIYHSADNSCEFLNVKKNFVLGGMEDVSYVQQEIVLEHGDLIFAYTDGVNEAMNENHEEYTSERLLKFMNGTDCRADLKILLAAVKADVAEHVGAAEQSDDITMLALRRN